MGLGKPGVGSEAHQGGQHHSQPREALTMALVPFDLHNAQGRCRADLVVSYIGKKSRISLDFPFLKTLIQTSKIKLSLKHNGKEEHITKLEVIVSFFRPTLQQYIPGLGHSRPAFSRCLVPSSLLGIQ